MQENNFEKQVQEKMGGLTVNPSEAVWEKVARGIEKKKRDWKLVYIFIIALVLISGSVATWVIIENNKTTHSSQARANTTTTEHTNIITGAIDNKEISESTAADTQKETEQNEPGKTETITTNKITVDQQNREKGTTVNNNLPIASNKAIAHRSENAKHQEALSIHNVSQVKGSRTGKTAVSIQNADIGNEENLQRIQTGDTDQDNIVANIENVDENFATPVVDKIVFANIDLLYSSDIKNTTSIEIRESGINSLSNNSQASKKNNAGHKWFFGVNLSGGISATRSGYFGIVGINSAEENKAFEAIPSSGVGNGIPNQAAPVMPPVIKPGKAFVVGLFAQKKLNKTISITTGFNYKFYSTKMTIGTRVDSFSNLYNSSFYYRSGNNTAYQNQYHFIELPIGFLFRLSKERTRLPVYWYAGLSMSRLIKSNVLQFSQSNGTYYADNNSLNKMQADLNTKLLFSISKNQRAPLLIGPDIKYALTKISGSGLYGGRRYSYLGLHLQKGIGL